jgi:hypothetical protein
MEEIYLNKIKQIENSNIFCNSTKEELILHLCRKLNIIYINSLDVKSDDNNYIGILKVIKYPAKYYYKMYEGNNEFLLKFLEDQPPPEYNEKI